MEKPRFLFAINPVSGGKQKQKIDWETEIKSYFSDASTIVEMHMLNGKDDECSLQQRIDTFKPDKIIAVGGDGTVKLIACLLLNNPIPLGILPAGSANGMATELKLPTKIKDALDIICNGKIKKIDMICINKKDFSIHLSDLGLNALLIKYYEDNNEHGKLGYAKAIFKTMWRKRILRLELQLNNGKFLRKAYMVVIANARTYGTGAVINPEGNLSDGKFEVIILKKISLFELFKMLITHQQFNPQKTELFQTEEIIIHSRRKTNFQIDGEYCGKTTSIQAKILKSALSVLVP